MTRKSSCATRGTVMSTFTIKFPIPDGEYMASEIAYVLRQIAKRVADGDGLEHWEPICDRNNNDVRASFIRS
jgi:hypothetical protein